MVGEGLEKKKAGKGGAHKAAVVHTLRHRASTFSSTFGALEEEKERVVNALLKNGYPKRFVQASPTPHV